MTLKELHDILFDMLCTVDDICHTNNINYSLGGGTMLGAVRHKGFIPWDDDVDICIWRRDYPKMRDALKANLPAHLKLVEPQDLFPNFHDFVCRVIDTRYTWHKETEEDRFYGNLQNHISIDIFFVDYSGNTLCEVRFFTLLHKIIYGLAMGHRYTQKYEKYTPLLKLQASTLAFVGSHLKMETILHWQKKLSQKKNNKPHKYCMITNDIPKYLGLPYESKWFTGIVYLPFRDRKFPVQIGYHEKLTLQYGNYMEPPKNTDEYIKHLENN